MICWFPGGYMLMPSNSSAYVSESCLVIDRSIVSPIRQSGWSSTGLIIWVSYITFVEARCQTMYWWLVPTTRIPLNMQWCMVFQIQPGMILILIFAEALGLYGLIVGLVVASTAEGKGKGLCSPYAWGKCSMSFCVVALKACAKNRETILASTRFRYSSTLLPSHLGRALDLQETTQGRKW